MITNRTFFVLLLAFLLSACTYPRYLPQPDEVGFNARGAYIIVKLSTPKNQTIRGELIATELKEIIILTDDNSEKEAVTVSLENIENYKLQYANSSKFDWTVPVFSLATLTHGWFAFITLPINLVTTSLSTSGIRYKYNQEELPIGFLNRFARFPQGVTSGVDINNLE
jgi:hypothetical protein